MAGVRITIRLLEIIRCSNYFEDRNSVYRWKFCLAYHDIRYTTNIEKNDIKNEFINNIKKLIYNVILFIVTISLLHYEIIYNSYLDNYDFNNFNEYIIKFFDILYILRWAGGLARFYFLLHSIEIVYSLLYIPFGIKASECFIQPEISQTANEFWSSRWNLSVGRTIRNVCYKPFLPKYKKIGEMAVFLGSAFLHVYPVYLLGGSIKGCFLTFLFFLLQIPIRFIEVNFKIKGHIWFLFIMSSITPLFIEPLYEIFPQKLEI